MSMIAFSHILLVFLVYLLFLSLNLSDLLLRILNEKIRDYTLDYKLVVAWDLILKQVMFQIKS